MRTGNTRIDPSKLSAKKKFSSETAYGSARDIL
jgi:hypothetical protein